MKSYVKGAALAVAVGLGLSVQDVQAQGVERRLDIEARAGVAVPTFDIADVADAGPSFGVGIAYPLSERLNLLADADFGFHGGAELAGGVDGPDVNVFHYMGKVGYDVLERPESRLALRVNAGLGAMTFDVDGGDSNTYFAINVGAKLAYLATEQVMVFLSPQGDIAFSDEDEVGTDNAWVWPFSAGLRVSF